MKILLGLTTTPGSDWQRKVSQINILNISEVALFVTGIGTEKRKELYSLLEKTNLSKIPHVHLRDDMEVQELEYLEKKFQTKVFNIHNKKDSHPFTDFKKNFGDYVPKTFIENNKLIPEEEELSGFGGLCIDFSHWEDGKLLEWESYKNNSLEKLAEKFMIGCCHISAVGINVSESNDVAYPEIVYKNYSKHIFRSLSEFDYMNKYLDYLPELVSLELENSFEEQLEVKKYLEKMIHER